MCIKVQMYEITVRIALHMLVRNPDIFCDFSQALNYSYLYTVNIWILLAPQWLCFDWSMGCIPTITSLDDVRLLAVVALWFALVVLGWTCLCSRYATTRRLFIF